MPAEPAPTVSNKLATQMLKGALPRNMSVKQLFTPACTNAIRQEQGRQFSERMAITMMKIFSGPLPILSFVFWGL